MNSLLRLALSFVVALLLVKCSTATGAVHPIAYPWRCGTPGFDCYVLGYEVDQDEAVSRASEVCIDGVHTLVPDPATHKALIVCK